MTELETDEGWNTIAAIFPGAIAVRGKVKDGWTFNIDAKLAHNRVHVDLTLPEADEEAEARIAEAERRE